MLYNDIKDLLEKTKTTIKVSNDGVKVKDKIKLQTKTIDELVYNLCLNQTQLIKDICYGMIWELANECGICPSSMHQLYIAKGEEKYKGMTVPAVNLRGLTYDAARALIRAARKLKSLAFVFEIAKSEMGYTLQRPKEYTAVCLAAAIKEGHIGPLFIQGDHFQLKEKSYLEDPDKEIEGMKKLITEAIDAGFYNIDIDSSTLVDLSQDSVDKQQWNNYDVTAKLSAYIRKIEPRGIIVSIGAEIGEVGGKNTTPEEFHAFMRGFRLQLDKCGKSLAGISKISIQTGTSHGGVVLPDGSMAKVNLDFNALRAISQIARQDYGISGAVQHGASTLPQDAFHHFPENETAEVHLATEFQNIIYESKYFPADLRKKIYTWLKENCAREKKGETTEEQFIYKTRKKGFGPFKKELMDLPEGVRGAIGQELEEKFTFLFHKLNATNTESLVTKFIKPIRIKKPIPQALVKS